MRAALKIAFWLVLALPAGLMLSGYQSGDTLAMDLLHPTGEMSIRLMLLALLAGPLIDIFGPNKFLRGWLAIRRNLGVAAFCYAALHLLFYLLDMRIVAAMIDEATLPPIWTGWLAFFAMLAPAAISTDAAMRRLGMRWKQVQRLVYPAYALAIAHWLLLAWSWGPAIIHLGPLLIAWLARWFVRQRRASRQKAHNKGLTA